MRSLLWRERNVTKGFENLVQAVTLGGRFTIGVETHKYVKECVNDEKPSVEKSEQSF